MKITQKRTTAKEKIIYVIKPYILYMLIKTVSLFALAIIIPSIPIPGMNGWVENNSDILSTICNAFASIIAVAFLLKDFIRDVSVSGELDIDANIIKQLLSYAKNGMFTTAVCNTRQKVIALVSTVIFGGSLGITLNIAVQIITDMMKSETEETYQKYYVNPCTDDTISSRIDQLINTFNTLRPVPSENAQIGDDTTNENSI